ncbi:hypothetical protein [Haladaptatus sp. W1]|uniref:hypothetical protein n=1 Tax=Haladaptatus sp. W1 TaxID=1897478 RepID=UPI001586685D|nr:hypothetical protein [Haladaptatus sp. W1]
MAKHLRYVVRMLFLWLRAVVRRKCSTVRRLRTGQSIELAKGENGQVQRDDDLPKYGYG